MNSWTDGATLVGSSLDSESFQKGLAMSELFQHNIRVRGNPFSVLWFISLRCISDNMVRGDRIVCEYCYMTPESRNSEVRIDVHY
jgi:hypothetical protein